MTTIKVRWAQSGFHRWPEAPQRVEYLRHIHRHLFHFQVELGVDHQDREVEFHQLLGQCQSMLELPLSEPTRFSCEDMAASILYRLTEIYPKRWAAVECWEDNECGARVTT